MDTDRKQPLPWLYDDRSDDEKTKLALVLVQAITASMLLLIVIGGFAYWVGTLAREAQEGRLLTQAEAITNTPVFIPAQPVKPVKQAQEPPTASAPAISPPAEITVAPADTPKPDTAKAAKATATANAEPMVPAKGSIAKVASTKIAKPVKAAQVRKERQKRISPLMDPTQPFILPEAAQPVVRGRSIQIGSYPNTAAAQKGWKALAAKWPYLATKTKIHALVWPQQDKSKAIHRWQIATDSQAQSVVICQQLAKAGQPCTVIY